MTNLVEGHQVRDFWLWVDPRDWLARHTITLTGAFVSSPADASAPALMFLPNPAFNTFIGPFQNNLLRNYIGEYNLELTRSSSFSQYPCRLQAIFLIGSENDAESCDFSGAFPQETPLIFRTIPPPDG